MGKIVEKQSQLNTAQTQAVLHKQGPALVVAGAGTGKTRVLVERFSRLVRDGIAPERILALTFTEKAAAEMVDRISQDTGAYQTEAPIMTFNAYGESLLRRYAADIGLGRNFTLMGESAQIVFLREHLDELGLDYFAPVSRPEAMLGDLRDYFSRLKQRVITPAIHLKHVSKLASGNAAEKLNKSKYQELATAYQRYIDLCRQTNVIDYDDQIYLMLELFEQRPNILAEIQALYDYVMVDEFQDTNTMQARLVDQIVGSSANLLVVGDDDQSIYGWRGATLANILQYKDRYPKAVEITLKENYRSTAGILDAAYNLIQNNNPARLEVRLGINKKLITSRKGKAPALQRFASLEEELAWIARDIKQRIADGADPASIAVLARRNVTVKELHGYLDFEDVDHVIIGQRYELYHEPVIRMMLEALKAVADPTDDLALYHTLISPLSGVSASLASKWAAEARRSHEPLESIVGGYKEGQKALGLIQGWREKLATLTVGQLTYEILDSSGYKDVLYAQALKDTSAGQAVSRLSELFTTMKQFEQIAVVPSAAQYIEALPALQATGDIGEDDTLDLSNQAVNVLTIHKSKGLEWPVVYIADLTEGSFPLRETSRGIKLPEGLVSDEVIADSHLSEERRLMYVAMTRARDELILTRAERHGSGALRKPSRFLVEAFGEPASNTVAVKGTATPRQLPSVGPFKLPDIALPSRMLRGDMLQLTVSQVQRYLDCPLDFYYCYLLNVPQEASPAQEYGNLMHDLLQDINLARRDGKAFDLAKLQQQLDQAWPRNGHLSAHQRDRARSRAHKTLDQLYKRFQADKRTPIAVEEAFSFTLPDAKLTIKGRFDVVLPHDNGIEIVDYKTSSSVDTAEKAKQRATNSQQLALYALAWQKLHDELPTQVSLDFIDTGVVGSVRKTQRGINGLEEKLANVANGLRKHEFGPGRDHLFCIHPPL